MFSNLCLDLYNYNNISNQIDWMKTKKKHIRSKHIYVYIEIGANLLHILSGRKVIERETSRNVSLKIGIWSDGLCAWALNFLFLYQKPISIHTIHIFTLARSLACSLIHLFCSLYLPYPKFFCCAEIAKRIHLTNWHKISSDFQSHV